MIETQLAQTKGSWREKIEKLQILLADLKPMLIAAEADLAERLAAISAFEFQVRVLLEPLTRRLESIEAEIRDYRGQLRQLQEDWLFLSEASEEARWAWQDGLNFSAGNGAAESGDFRYREAPTTPQAPKALSEDEEVPENFSRPEVLEVLRAYYAGIAKEDRAKVELKGHSAK